MPISSGIVCAGGSRTNHRRQSIAPKIEPDEFLPSPGWVAPHGMDLRPVTGCLLTCYEVPPDRQQSWPALSGFLNPEDSGMESCWPRHSPPVWPPAIRGGRLEVAALWRARLTLSSKITLERTVRRQDPRIQERIGQNQHVNVVTFQNFRHVGLICVQLRLRCRDLQDELYI